MAPLVPLQTKFTIFEESNFPIEVGVIEFTPMTVCIRKRGKSYSAYWREGGKLKEMTLGRNHHLATIRQREIEERLTAQRHGLPIRIYWSEFKKKYFGFSKTNHSTQTTLRCETVFKNFEDAIHVNHLTDLTPELLEDYKSIRRGAGIQASTINRELTTLKFAVKQAGAWGYKTPDLKSVKRIPTVKKRPDFFEEGHIQSLLSEASPLWKTVILLGFFAGLRRDEILHLDWTDVDFETNQLKITPKDDWHPKDREAREVPIHPSLKDHLDEWKKQSTESNRVVPWPHTPIALTEAFSRMRQRVGIKFGTLHTLRHSFASHLAMGGVDLLRIGKMMGHSSITTTQAYAHLLPSSLREAVQKIPSIGKIKEMNGA